jgi:hypothetical protein
LDRDADAISDDDHEQASSPSVSAPSYPGISTHSSPVMDALRRLEAHDREFEIRHRSFQAPDTFHFSSDPRSHEDEPSPLVFRLNRTFLEHKEWVEAIIDQVDAIGTHGSEKVRTKRKQLVDKLQLHASTLENYVRQSWDVKKMEMGFFQGEGDMQHTNKIPGISYTGLCAIQRNQARSDQILQSWYSAYFTASSNASTNLSSYFCGHRSAHPCRIISRFLQFPTCCF